MRRLVQNAAGRILQEALLAPQGPRVSAIEDPRGHLPSSAAPGAWVDVIPLPSARVALVTGTVRGQGLSAATAMSQLKAAVRALVLLDMSPGEVISRLHRPAATPVGNEADRCLIVVYDPVACRCTVACGGCTSAAPAAGRGGRGRPRARRAGGHRVRRAARQRAGAQLRNGRDPHAARRRPAR